MADRWVQEHQRDSWRRQAKHEGYRARSAYKLKQIQEKYNVIRDGDIVLDVGCHPGGWAQVAVEFSGENGTVIGIDLETCHAVDGAELLVGDITNPDAQEKILIVLNGRKINTVISDISPDLTGNWNTDQAVALDLVAKVFDFSLPLLNSGGTLVTKLFQGVGIDELINAIRPHFSKVRRYNPEASRNSSSEVYLVCRNHKPFSLKKHGTILARFEEMMADFDDSVQGEDEAKIGFRIHKSRGN